MLSQDLDRVELHRMQEENIICFLVIVLKQTHFKGLNLSLLLDKIKGIFHYFCGYSTQQQFLSYFRSHKRFL